MKYKSVILDRDGVINEDSAGYIKSLAEWVPISGSLQAIADLSKSGFSVFVITNQSGIGRGLIKREQLTEIHHYLLKVVESAGGKIEQVLFCPHHPDEGCGCRKPATGMLQKITQNYTVDFTKSYLIGDRLSDLYLGDHVGAQSILVLTGAGKETEAQLPQPHSYPIFANLAAAANSILQIAP